MYLTGSANILRSHSVQAYMSKVSIGGHGIDGIKGPLTIWPVYAYTLAAQNTVIKLPMLILYTEDNSAMSYKEIHVQTFTYSVIIW